MLKLKPYPQKPLVASPSGRLVAACDRRAEATNSSAFHTYSHQAPV